MQLSLHSIIPLFDLYLSTWYAKFDFSAKLIFLSNCDSIFKYVLTIMFFLTKKRFYMDVAYVHSLILDLCINSNKKKEWLLKKLIGTLNEKLICNFKSNLKLMWCATCISHKRIILGIFWKLKTEIEFPTKIEWWYWLFLFKNKRCRNFFKIS